MGHEGGHVQDAVVALHLVEVVTEALPVPGHALVERRTGDVLHAFHEADEEVPLAGPDRGKAHTAVAGDHGGHAMPARWRHLWIPGDLAVVMGVDVHPSGGDQGTVGVDLAHPGCVHVPDGHHDASVDGDIGGAGRCSGAIGNGSSTDDQVVHDGSPSLVVRITPAMHAPDATPGGSRLARERGWPASSRAVGTASSG